MGSRAVITLLVIVVAAVVGVSIGGAVLAAMGITVALIAAVVGVAFWKRRRKPAAIAAYVVAALGAVVAVIGFADAIG